MVDKTGGLDASDACKIPTASIATLLIVQADTGDTFIRNINVKWSSPASQSDCTDSLGLLRVFKAAERVLLARNDCHGFSKTTGHENGQF
jgi:hypothetical protein